MDIKKSEILSILDNFKGKYPSSALPRFVDEGFADVILPETNVTESTEEITEVKTFSDIKKLIAKSGSDKASFRSVSEAAWNYNNNEDYEDIYIPGGSNVWRYMSDEQLRCYYSRREDFRKGIFNTKFPTYIYIYISENLIRENAPENLAFILSNTAYKYPNIKSDLCRYIKDYYIVNEIDTPFADFIKDIGAENYFPSYMNPPEDDTLGKLFAAGDYDLTKSKFITEHTQFRRDFPKIFEAVMINSEQLFSLFNIDISSLIRSDGGETEYYYPFNGVLYAGEFSRKSTASLTPTESYVRRGTWFMRSVSHTPSSARKFSGFIKRSIDTELRSLTDYRYPLTDNAKTLSESMEALGGSRLSEKLAKIISSNYLHEIIREICTEYLRGEENLYSRTGLLLSEQMRTELLLSYKKIQSNEKNPLRNLGIEEYSDYRTWRNSIDNGVFEASAFVKTYISEIFHTKYSSPEQGFEKLAILTANLPMSASIKKEMANSLKNYYTAHKISDDFELLVKKYNLTEIFPEIFIHSEDKILRAEALIKLSGKKIKIPPEMEALFLAVIDRIYENIRETLKERSINPTELFFVTDYANKGFTAGSLAPERKIFPHILSFAVKFSEQILRRELGFSGKLNFENHSYFSSKLEEKCTSYFYGNAYYGANAKLWRTAKEYFLSEEFPTMIEETAVSVLKNDFPDVKIYPIKKAIKPAKQKPIEIPPEPIEVKVDFSKLDNIREEADEITKKLAAEDVFTADLPAEVTEFTKNIPEEVPEYVLIPIIDSDNPYESFYQTLNGDYKEILSLIITGKDVNKYLREKNILPEVAAEYINEIALETTGDIIIEDMNIVTDYLEDVRKLLK
ncbi:MAG: hypothetical protein LBL80_01510 [Ruminococcus sp.]|jgi:hypothetical protein|nr:hypothetical protein [Ruminococcus sp.]